MYEMDNVSAIYTLTEEQHINSGTGARGSATVVAFDDKMVACSECGLL